MAKKQAWDFECPQYVDFEREVDRSGIDDVFFDCKDKSPENESLCKTPGVLPKEIGVKSYPDRQGILPKEIGVKPYPDRQENQAKVKGLTESDENRLLDKMSAALSILENTPKVKKNATRGKLFSERLLKGLSSNITKSTVKPNTVPAPLQTSRRRSKSLTRLNKLVSVKTNKTGLHRSSSLNDFGVYRKAKYPVTPMCLKRTIFKAKEKIKTTEERELEEIAKLQKQLIQHLRQNEITLKKLKLKPRQAVVPKPLSKCDGLKETTGLNAFPEKSSIVDKEQNRRNIRMLHHTEVKKEAAKLDNIINKESGPSKKMNNTIYCKKLKSLSVSEFDLDVSKSTIRKMKKQSHNRIVDHSGLTFFPSMKSNPIIKPFIFEAKTKEIMPHIVGAKWKEKSTLNFQENYDKENFPCIGSQFAVKKTKEVKNAECDKLVDYKIAGKAAANLSRGVPLAENFTRD